MATFDQFLDSLDPEIKGKQFEVFIKWFLKNDPEWSTQVDQIWLWDEYPERWGPDCGIDLVFKHKNSEIWAVQAKCYSPEYSITKKDIDTFLSESNRSVIDKRLLVASTDLIGTNAKSVCDEQEKDVVRFLYSDFEKAEIEYPEDISELNKAKPKESPKPRLHQLEAVDAVEKGFKNNERGQLIIACGTGKTYTTLWVKERINSQSTLVLVPSLSLLSQTLREWTFASKELFDVLCVCSDETVGKKSVYDPIIQSVHDLPFPVSSDVEEIRHFLQGKGSKVIFSTYHSSPLIAESQNDSKTTMFDLVIADEAHRCTGEAGSAFTAVLDDSLIKAKKRLFTTATPKTFTANLKKSAEERGVEIAGMDDEDVFGKVFYSLPFGEAIKRNLLTDYQVVIVGVDKPMISKWIEKRELLKTSSGEITDAETLAAQIGLIKAIKDYDLKRIISFHSRVKEAESFSVETQYTIKSIAEKHLPKGNIWTDFVSGLMSSDKRNKKLKQLKDLSLGDRGLLSNARCLSEGIDVPSLDGVAFIDPKGSQVDIVQAVGRAIRLSEKKTMGTIFLPVFIKDGDDAEISIQSSNFKPVWSVLNALKSHDDVLSIEMDQLRTNLGRQNHKGKIQSIPKVVIDFPQTVNESFAESLKIFLVEKTTASWNFYFGLLEDYVEKEKDTRVHSRYKVDDFSLGSWVENQRQNKEQLTKEQFSKLNLLGFDWDPNNTRWEEGFEHFKEYVDREGNAIIPYRYKSADGYSLDRWVRQQRRKKTYQTPERISRLDALGFDWDPLKTLWERGFKHLEKFAEKEKHVQVPDGFQFDGYGLGNWVSSQRQKKNKLTSDQISRLDAMEFNWDPLINQWEEGFKHLEKFVENEGHANVHQHLKTEDNFSLGKWVSTQRLNRKKLTQDLISRLDSLDFDWDPINTKWEKGFTLLEKYVQENGNANVHHRYLVGKFRLGRWVGRLRDKRDKLTSEQISRLDSLGFDWDPHTTSWDEGFNNLEKYVEKNKNALVPARKKLSNGFFLGKWVTHQRDAYKKGKLDPERILKLNSLGFVWDTFKTQWENWFSLFEKFVEKEGHAIVPYSHKTEEYQLGHWVSNQRKYKDQLSNEQKSKLDALGFVWKVK